jgi:ABC-type multidrug transport system fused ATPase/permease subunit
VQSENFAEPGAPDRIPDDLVEKYGREARKTVKHNLSRRSRLARRTRRAGRVVRGGGADLWQTTAVVFSLSVIALCGIGALVYAVYLWPRIGLSLVGAVVIMFTFSYVVARRVTRRGVDPSQDEVSLF